MLLTKTFAEGVYRNALESWSWLELGERVPVLASPFGDVFLQDTDGYWFLDSLEGNLTQVASTRDETQAILDTPERQDRYLLGALAMAAERHGLHLKPGEVYDFKVPPVLSGQIDVENIVVMDFVVSLNLAGQIHDQVRNLPPGTKISGIKMEE